MNENELTTQNGIIKESLFNHLKKWGFSGLILVGLLVAGYCVHVQQIENMRQKAEIDKIEAERAKRAEIDKIKEEMENAKGKVHCENCNNSFPAAENKATRWQAVTVGVGAGAATGAVGGFYAGAGTGVAAGPLGAAAGATVFGVIGGAGGGIIGGMGGLVYANERVKCPHCGKVFKNPLN